MDMTKLIGAFRDFANSPATVQNVVFLYKEVKIKVCRSTVFTVVLYGCPRCRWEDNIKVDRFEVGWVGRHGLD
jgi:hypothetical protein